MPWTMAAFGGIESSLPRSYNHLAWQSWKSTGTIITTGSCIFFIPAVTSQFWMVCFLHTPTRSVDIYVSYWVVWSRLLKSMDSTTSVSESEYMVMFFFLLFTWWLEIPSSIRVYYGNVLVLFVQLGNFNITLSSNSSIYWLSNGFLVLLYDMYGYLEANYYRVLSGTEMPTFGRSSPTFSITFPWRHW
jgi:hypothetical protein